MPLKPTNEGALGIAEVNFEKLFSYSYKFYEP